MSATLTESTFESSGYKWCVHSLTDNCNHAPCNIAQGVECCGECEHVRECSSPCWAMCDFYADLGGDVVLEYPYRYCPNCGARVLDD